MSYQIFVRNVAPVVTTQDLAQLFSTYGKVVDIKRPFDQKRQQPQLYAFVRMGSDDEAAAAIAGLTGYAIGGMELELRKAEPQSKRKPEKREFQQKGRPKTGFKKKKKTDPAREAIWKRTLEIAEILGEKEKRPIAQIARLIELKGFEYVDTLLENTQRLEEAGGMLTLDGTRRRTIGGIFYKLAKDRLDEETRQIIFPGWRELKRRAAERKEKAKSKEQKHQKSEAKTSTSDRSEAAPKRTITKPKLTISPATGGANTPVPPEIREELNRLREAERLAQQRLADIKSQRVKGGMLEAMKEVADLKARILQILQAYPSLK
ncbi:MAG: hypothetical protein CUN55_06070 [Phototrophicales bacterium]|nr:MAG: hypothetical protein CUN55_06070 [Phototrophicales bacterium]